MKRQVPDASKKFIEQVVDDAFEKTARDMLGYIPGDQKKTIIFASKRPSHTLADLFVKSMRDHAPSSLERDTLKGLIRIAYNFIAGLKERTKASVVSKVDAIVRESSHDGGRAKAADIQKAIEEEMSKARSHMKTIAEAEGTKSRNMGAAMDIIKVGASIGNPDPNCFFIVKRDEFTCKHCINNHLNPDGTPKVFKLSEIATSYLSSDDRKAGKVSCAGQHPNCRCSLSILAPGWGFKDGKVAWVGIGHDELVKQRS